MREAWTRYTSNAFMFYALRSMCESVCVRVAAHRYTFNSAYKFNFVVGVNSKCCLPTLCTFGLRGSTDSSGSSNSSRSDSLATHTHTFIRTYVVCVTGNSAIDFSVNDAKYDRRNKRKYASRSIFRRMRHQINIRENIVWQFDTDEERAETQSWQRERKSKKNHSTDGIDEKER